MKLKFANEKEGVCKNTHTHTQKEMENEEKYICGEKREERRGHVHTWDAVPKLLSQWHASPTHFNH